MKLPPRWVRRVILWPLPLLLVWIYLATIPILLIVAFVLSYKLPGKLRAVRSLGLATVYAFVEVSVLVAGFGLWVASGFGRSLGSERSLDRHYRLLAWALRVLVGAGTRLFVVRIEAGPGEGSAAADSADAAPLIVMSRHAGPADSILLLHEVAVLAGRRPRIVLKETLQLDPAFDLLLNRIPNRFVGPSTRGTPAGELIGELVEDMDADDAFVIFPEGGNFTSGRRRRAIDSLERRGHAAAAARARKLRNVLPPRPGGTLAALTACPDASAVFVAHTGLDEIAGVRDLWRSIPDHKSLHLAWRVIPAPDIPADEAGKTELLWREWEAIDRWIDAHRTESTDSSDAAVS